MNLQALLSDALAGRRLTAREAELLFSVTGPDVYDLFRAADEMCRRKNGNRVTFVRNQNIHITNICKNLCGFCGFGRAKNSPGAYLSGEKEIKEQIQAAKDRKVTEICFLSGVHPDFTLETYLQFMRWVHEIYPSVHIHAFSPDEVDFVAGKAGLPTPVVIEKLMKGGLGTLQGTAAEILVDEVRKTICPAKVKTGVWKQIIREAHSLGLKSTATIMYGSAESYRDRAEHLDLIRSIQDETGGFTEMVLLSYVHHKTSLYEKGMVRSGPTGRDDLVTTAVSRLFLDNFDHIQISWPKLGIKMTQMALLAGADDLAGTMYLDDVTGEAGGDAEDYLDHEDMKYLCSDIGRELAERTTLYSIIS
jgi:FO synthase subunit 2